MYLQHGHGEGWPKSNFADRLYKFLKWFILCLLIKII